MAVIKKLAVVTPQQVRKVRADHAAKDLDRAIAHVIEVLRKNGVSRAYDAKIHRRFEPVWNYIRRDRLG